jgi:hypothetical protein
VDARRPLYDRKPIRDQRFFFPYHLDEIWGTIKIFDGSGASANQDGGIGRQTIPSKGDHAKTPFTMQIRGSFFDFVEFLGVRDFRSFLTSKVD